MKITMIEHSDLKPWLKVYTSDGRVRDVWLTPEEDRTFYRAISALFRSGRVILVNGTGMHSKLYLFKDKQ